MSRRVETLKGVVAELDRQALREGDIRCGDDILILRGHAVQRVRILALDDIHSVVVCGHVKCRRDLEEAVEDLLLSDDGRAGLLEPVIAEDVVDMRLGVDQVLDASGLLLGERDHLLQVGDPLRGVDKDSAFLGKHHAGVTASDLCLCVYIGC